MSQREIRIPEEVTEVPTSQLRVGLHSILGFVQLHHLSRENLTPAQLRHLASIEAAAGQLLDYTSGSDVRAGGLVFERVVIDIDQAVTTAFRTLAPLTRSRRVRLQFDPSRLTILGDREQFEQMLVNLAGCAVEASAEGGAVRLRANRFGNGIRLAIAGTGIQIPAGLTAAKRLAGMMGGELEWLHGSDGRIDVSIRIPSPPAPE